MPYSDVDGYYTVFPTAPKLRKAPKAPKARKPKPPCKYGPRLANGRCPSKPRTPRAQAAGVARGIYSTATGAKRGSAGDRVAGAAGAALGSLAARRLRSEILKKTATGAAARLATLGTGATLSLAAGSVLAAGLLAYYLTKSLIDNRANARADRAQRAFLAARAYRDARLAAVELNGGRPISGRDSEALADAFRAQLQELGLSTTNLKGL